MTAVFELTVYISLFHQKNPGITLPEPRLVPPCPFGVRDNLIS